MSALKSWSVFVLFLLVSFSAIFWMEPWNYEEERSYYLDWKRKNLMQHTQRCGSKCQKSFGSHDATPPCLMSSCRQHVYSCCSVKDIPHGVHPCKTNMEPMFTCTIAHRDSLCMLELCQMCWMHCIICLMKHLQGQLRCILALAH